MTGFTTRGVPAWWQAPAAGILGEFPRREDPELRGMQFWLQTPPDAFMCRSFLLPIISAGVREHHRRLQIIKTKKKRTEKCPQKIRPAECSEHQDSCCPGQASAGRFIPCLLSREGLAASKFGTGSLVCSGLPYTILSAVLSAWFCITMSDYSSGSPETFALLLLNPNNKIIHYLRFRRGHLICF